ncbi:exonuclease [Cellvibrio zantedeschiae]|uniref:Excinuclease cho n=1 Tax=Cellvibrio zantedeschiae TaxID=1237077 RepID=A0ABQ3B9Z4_9GAMM|nr:exonuclease domain-containing protein [Cellvibrio zantedeschiae]GGY84440.1 exonuclease [Cellvibrio zantedeschiae]
MLKHFPLPCVIVDIETTGGNVTYDRITEIGIIEVTENGITEWSTLINPRTKVPETIQRLTGITNAMVESAPYFEQVAKEIILKLQGKLFIAHNVRFDYGFIRNEFARLAYTYKAKLMCTVKLSRFLYSECDGHSLEKIIKRHQIFVSDRHRALADAQATYTFMRIAEDEHGEDKIKSAIAHQYRKESIPAGFDATLIDELPNSPGVYYFWGENKELLYIGKSINIRKRVLSHFTSDHKSSKEMKICQQTRHVTFDKTAGELTALILESKKVKELNPIYNRRLRRVSKFYSVHLEENAEGLLKPHIFSVSEIPAGRKKLYGLFPSNKKARDSLELISNEHKLCYQVIGLEQTAKRACTSHQLKKCEGYCVGKQSAVVHNLKLLQGLSTLALKTWPYQGPIALIEQCKHDEREVHLLVDNWCILGAADSVADYSEILNKTSAPEIDRDIYKYLVKAIYSKSMSIKLQPLFK